MGGRGNSGSRNAATRVNITVEQWHPSTNKSYRGQYASMYVDVGGETYMIQYDRYYHTYFLQVKEKGKYSYSFVHNPLDGKPYNVGSDKKLAMQNATSVLNRYWNDLHKEEG